MERGSSAGGGGRLETIVVAWPVSERRGEEEEDGHVVQIGATAKFLEEKDGRRKASVCLTKTPEILPPCKIVSISPQT